MGYKFVNDKVKADFITTAEESLRKFGRGGNNGPFELRDILAELQCDAYERGVATVLLIAENVDDVKGDDDAG